MKKINTITPIPKAHQILWWVCRAFFVLFSVYGILNDSVTMYLMGLFATAFSHMWDMWQMFGGKSFITRVNYFSQTLLNIFIVYSCFVYIMNTRTNIHFFDIISHFCAGFISTWFGYDFAVVFQGKKRHLSPALASFFALTFSMFIAVAWEFYEFTMDRIYGYMLQTSDILSETGLIDTMTDFICCAAGSVLGMFLVAFYRNGILGGKNRKKLRAEVVARSKQDRKEELELLGIEEENQ